MAYTGEGSYKGVEGEVRFDDILTPDRGWTPAVIFCAATDSQGIIHEYTIMK